LRFNSDIIDSCPLCPSYIRETSHERHLTKQETADGKVLVRAKNEKPEANAVISIIEWVEKK